MKVYQAIAAVQGELAKVGIAKGRRNQQQGYNFRGIDEVYAALSPLLAKHSLCVIPRCLERVMVEGRTAKGNPLFTVTVRAEFDFVSAEDGSSHTAATYGEAMDTADKATNKAMSAAYKYAAFMTFAIPTEGDNDADAVTHEVAPRSAPSDAGKTSTPRAALAGPYTSKTALWNAVKAFDRELRSCGDPDQLDAFVGTDDSKALLEQCERDAPQLLHGGDTMPPEYEPLYGLIAKLRSDLEAAAQYHETQPEAAE